MRRRRGVSHEASSITDGARSAGIRIHMASVVSEWPKLARGEQPGRNAGPLDARRVKKEVQALLLCET